MIPLANRRFVSFAFDVATPRDADSRAALEFVEAAKPDLRPRRGTPWNLPPVLFTTADGDLLAEADPFATEEELRVTMRRLLDLFPEYDRPTAAERGERDVLTRARTLVELSRDREAAGLLEGREGDGARLLRALLARYRRDPTAAARELNGVGPDFRPDAVATERARLFLSGGGWREALAILGKVAEDSPKWSEARYLEGLVLHRHRRRADARAVWKALAEGRPADPWARRADWAFGTSRAATEGERHGGPGGTTVISSGPTPLSRLGYAGPGNPDLDPRGS